MICINGPRHIVENDSRVRDTATYSVYGYTDIGREGRVFSGSVQGRRYLDVTNEQLPGTISRGGERSRKSSACSGKYSNKIFNEPRATIQCVFRLLTLFLA